MHALPPQCCHPSKSSPVDQVVVKDLDQTPSEYLFRWKVDGYLSVRGFTFHRNGISLSLMS